MNQATADYIRAHADADVRQLALQGKQEGVDLLFALQQIAGRQTAKTKLPSWAAVDGIVYPPHLSMEQCSSEPTARYKAMLVGGGSWLVDLTGGFGVDFSFMARQFDEAVYVERQQQLCDIAAENFRLLGVNARVEHADSTDYLRSLDHASLIYIDPARRDEHGARTYGIGDCTPNVLELKAMLLAKTDRLLIKLSPMLDWRKAVADLGMVSEVHIVSVGNECKELLLKMEPHMAGDSGEEKAVRVVCVNMLADGSMEHFDFLSPSEHSAAPVIRPDNGRYLLEPNASLMKAGCFREIAMRYGIGELGRNSHLFISETPVETFPGRQFEIDHTCTMNKRELREALRGLERGNIAVRNFPLSADQLRQRLKLKDGGDTYIFATTIDGGAHRLFFCRKYGR